MKALLATLPLAANPNMIKLEPNGAIRASGLVKYLEAQEVQCRDRISLKIKDVETGKIFLACINKK